MIFPAEMERVEIAFLSEDRERVLESLQKEGVMEINETDKGMLQGIDVDTGHVSSLHVRSEKIIRDLDVPKSFLDSASALFQVLPSEIHHRLRFLLFDCFSRRYQGKRHTPLRAFVS